jgi:hypothetical protein
MISTPQFIGDLPWRYMKPSDPLEVSAGTPTESFEAPASTSGGSEAPSSPKAAEDKQRERDYNDDDDNGPQHLDAPSS